jgi:hypothetical protein
LRQLLRKLHLWERGQRLRAGSGGGSVRATGLLLQELHGQRRLTLLRGPRRYLAHWRPCFPSPAPPAKALLGASLRVSRLASARGQQRGACSRARKLQRVARPAGSAGPVILHCGGRTPQLDSYATVLLTVLEFGYFCCNCLRRPRLTSGGFAVRRTLRW